MSEAGVATKNSIGSLAWMTGQWVGKFGEDPVEEHWSTPAGNGMMGMFRWMRDGQARFYELVTLEEEEGEIYLRIKHFNPGLKGWEEKDDSVKFRLVSLEGESARFVKLDTDQTRWIVYQRPEADTLVTWFESEEGIHAAEHEFRYSRIGAG